MPCRPKPARAPSRASSCPPLSRRSRRSNHLRARPERPRSAPDSEPTVHATRVGGRPSRPSEPVSGPGCWTTVVRSPTATYGPFRRDCTASQFSEPVKRSRSAARPWREGAIIEAQEGGEGRGNLALGYGGELFRSPSAGVSGPITAIQIRSEPLIFAPWLFHSTGASPRPWSVVTIIVVVPRYSGSD